METVKAQGLNIFERYLTVWVILCIVGGIVAASSLPCNPGIFIVIGAAILQGKVLWAILMLAMFAIGFSLPLGAVLLGISLSKVSLAARGADAAIRWIAGVVLVIAGFYFLLTF